MVVNVIGIGAALSAGFMVNLKKSAFLVKKVKYQCCVIYKEYWDPNKKKLDCLL